MLNIFYEMIFIAIDLFVPLKKYSAIEFPVWFSIELKNCIIGKKEMHKKYKQTRSVTDYREFSRLRQLSKRLTQECYTQYVHCTEAAISSNIKKFWSFVNHKRKNSSFPSSLKYLDRTGCSGEEIANMFADYFSTVYSHHIVNVSTHKLSSSDTHIPHLDIRISDIFTKLSSLDANKGPGPDGVPTLFKQNAALISLDPCITYSIFPFKQGCSQTTGKSAF